jgi:nitrogen regulatory protein P-II 1
MEWKNIIAIFRSEELERVERSLREVGVRGITVTRVKGYGEYADLFSRNGLVPHTRIEVFNTGPKAEEIARVIMDSAHSGIAGDGIVAILPVERIYRIRSKKEAGLGEI